MIAARKKGDLLVLDRGMVVERKKARFGLALTDGNVFGGGAEDQATEVKEVETTIKEVADASYGRYNIGFANGMVWQTTEPISMARQDRRADQAERSLARSFQVVGTGGESVKVKRIR